jgi:hypothetical protein
MSTLRVLLNRLVDYAGLFPPAELAMGPAVSHYQNYLRGPNRWMLGRFIVPATRLEEFEQQVKTLPLLPADELPWRVSALIPPASQTKQLQTWSTPLALVDTLEGKASDVDDIADAATLVPQSYSLFLELPADSAFDVLIAQIENSHSEREVFAKIRTGGVVAQAIPSADRLAAFIGECAVRDVGFKATAGLHHPIRANYRLTYQENSPCAEMFGFLNVFVAACAAWEDPANRRRIAAILAETDASQFRFGKTTLEWENASWPLERLRRVRDRAISFGSCSFEEPVADLRVLGLLSDEA